MNQINLPQNNQGPSKLERAMKVLDMAAAAGNIYGSFKNWPKGVGSTQSVPQIKPITGLQYKA